MTDAEIARLRRLLRASPDSLQFVALGEALRCRGQLEEAHRVLTRGLSHHPSLHSAQSCLARVYAEQGAPDQALSIVVGLLARDPGDLTLRILHIELLIALGRRREAASALPGIPEADPRHAALTARLRMSRRSDPFATRELAERLERAGRLERAASVWQTIARQESDPAAEERASALRRRASRAAPLEVVALRDERSAAPVRPARPGHLRRLLDLLRRAEQEV